MFPFSQLPIRAAVASFYHYALAKGDNTDIYDPGSLATAGSFVVPAAWNGRRVRVMAGEDREVGATNTIEILKGAASYIGAGKSAQNSITGQTETGYAQSAPTVVSTSDTFTMTGVSGTASGAWKFFEVMPLLHKGTLASRITSGLSVGSAFTDVTWNNEVYDDISGFTPSSVTILYDSTAAGAAGSGLCRFMCNVEMASSTELGVKITGGALTGVDFCEADVVGTTLSLMTPPLATVYDTAKVQIRTTAAININADDNSWFAMEELPVSLKYAIAEVTSNKTIPTGSVFTAFNADFERKDIGAWFTAGQSKFTVPSGVTQVRVGFFVVSSNTLGSTWGVAVFQNGAVFAGMPVNATSNANVERSHAVSGIIQCVAGDTFDFYAKTAAGAMNVAAGSIVWIEEVPVVTS